MRVVAIFVCLSACVSETPLVSDFNGYTVRIVSHAYPLGDGYKESPIYTKAVETCGGDAAYQGVRRITEFQGEHVFLCER